jgi:hypothetical protein
LLRKRESTSLELFTFESSNTLVRVV